RSSCPPTETARSARTKRGLSRFGARRACAPRGPRRARRARAPCRPRRSRRARARRAERDRPACAPPCGAFARFRFDAPRTSRPSRLPFTYGFVCELEFSHTDAYVKSQSAEKEGFSRRDETKDARRADRGGDASLRRAWVRRAEPGRHLRSRGLHARRVL